MSFDKLAGTASAVGIILILTIAFDLSKWQPLAAALLALGGGFLAYRGAMAKVEVDREENKREFLRRQLASYLKLDIAVEGFQPEAKGIEARLVFLDEGEGIPVRELRIKEPAEIDEAWGNLDVFPRKTIRQIAVIRGSIRRLDELLNEVTDDRVLKGDATQEGTRLNLILSRVSAISDACGLIIDVLRPEIERLAPEIPERERMLRLYGEPDVGDG